MARFNGFVSTVAGSATAYEFVGPTTTLVVTAGQRVSGTAAVPLGTSTGVALLRLGLCHQLSTATTPTNFVGFGYAVVEVDTTCTAQAASGSVVLSTAGSYTVGVCVYNSGAQALDSNNYLNGWVMVTND